VRVAVALLALCVSGCAGSDMHGRMLEGYGDVTVNATPGPGYDFTVSLKNKVDFGYDPDDPESRKNTALQFARHQCPEPAIVGENMVTTGKYLTGKDSRVYSVQIKCGPKS
jgi:hypothetical protein